MLVEALAAAYTASAVLFAAVAWRLARAYARLGFEELLGLAWGFGLLTASSVLGAAEALASTPRLSLTFYTGSASSAAAGFLVIVYSARAAGREQLYAIAPLALGALVDAAATVLAGAAAATARGAARRGFTVLAAAHALRTASVAAATPWGEWGGLLLLASEAVRAVGAGLLAAYYAGGVLVPRGEEE